MNILNEVVDKGWCVGCGMCAAICPKNRLDIRWNDSGELNPVEMDGAAGCSENCFLCYHVCPAHGNTKNETEIGHQWYGSIAGIQHTVETGYFLSAYAGYSREHRANGASGGMATWVLEQLLHEGTVSSVVAVGSMANADRLFDFKICKSIEDIRNCSRSAYYPVEASSVIRYILDNDGTYAVIGLPCLCKALRLAQEKFPLLRKRIGVVIGLVCGRQCSKYFAEYVCALGGGDPYKLKQIVFRAKDLTQPANNHLMEFSFEGDNGLPINGKRLWHDGIGTAFTNGYFQPNGCFYCDDVFAECADAVFMDAWLPEYVSDPKGNSLVIARSKRIDKLFEKENKNIVLRPISINQVIKSQEGVIKRKRARRLSSEDSPILRSEVLLSASFLQHKTNQIKQKIAFGTKESWSSDKNIGLLNATCRKYLQRLKFYSKVLKILTLPQRIMKKICGCASKKG
ncbi:MAG: Coenzyme F420 hydrogenase/dehydrogenase, beta subunit C-terminal domain [Thermotogota bacterium]|nr:Coenzyme F420 hydrogenase/dehydrogenase, beta subunit C-terminal domain [Thermotogota bacterium]